MPSRLALSLRLLVALASCSALAPAQAPVAASARDESPVAARGGDWTLSLNELQALLLERHWMTQDGRDILRHLVQTRLIDKLGEDAGLRVSQRDINALWDRLDRDAKMNGVEGGMAAELARTGMTAEDFRDVLRLQIVQEELTRRSLGLGKDARISGDQMRIWIDAEVEARGLQLFEPPWVDGVVAVCGDVRVTTEGFADLLARHLPAETVQQSAFHALLLRGIQERMPDVSAEARAAAIEAELDHRRRKVAADPIYKGVPFEELLGAQGLTIDDLRRDPAVEIAAMSQVWVDRKYDDAGLRAEYDADRTFFDNRFGEALQLFALFLRAAKFKNKWNPRTFEEAEAELRGLSARAIDLAAFQEQARALSEDPATKEAGGELGWVTRGEEAVPPSIREAAFTWLGAGGDPQRGGVLAPVRLENGVVLVWVAGRRSAPAWEGMRDHVHRELRGRFLRGVLTEDQVWTFRRP